MRFTLAFRTIVAETEDKAWEKAAEILEKVKANTARLGGNLEKLPSNVGSVRLREAAARGKVLESALRRPPQGLFERVLGGGAREARGNDDGHGEVHEDAGATSQMLATSPAWASPSPASCCGSTMGEGSGKGRDSARQRTSLQLDTWTD